LNIIWKGESDEVREDPTNRCLERRKSKRQEDLAKEKWVSVEKTSWNKKKWVPTISDESKSECQDDLVKEKVASVK